MKELAVDTQEPAKKAPPVESAMELYRARMGKLLDLTPAQRTRLTTFLENNLDGWEKDTAVLHARLRDDNDLVEGVVEDSSFPWEGASIVHVPVTEMYMEVYHSILRRSILGAGIVWVATTDNSDEMLMEATDEVADMMNDKAMNEWNVEHALEGVMWTTCRDGLGIIQVSWVEQYEEASDVLLIDNLDEFLAEFPDPESAGISEAEYQELAEKAASATQDQPLEVPIKFQKLKYFGNRCDIVELVDFVTFPATVQDIKHESCRGYGKRYYERNAVIKAKGEGENPLYYADAVKKVLEADKSSVSNELTVAQDQVEGLGRSTRSEKQLFEMAVKFSLDEGDPERQYLVTFYKEDKVVLAAKAYPYRVDNVALFRVSKRANRMIGRSIPNKTRDINDEIDTMHRQRVNSRTITHVPSFIGDSSKKKEFLQENPDQTFFPGVKWWIPGGAESRAIDQFKVQPVDLGDSMAEENNDMRLLDLFLGAAVALLSGQTAPGDPNAPGNKTNAMIGQSNLRMDDPLSEFRHGVNELGDICLSHLYQFGPAVLDYMSRTEGAEEAKTLYKKVLRTGIKMKMAGVTITQNPETEMAQGFMLFQQLMAWPVFQNNAQGQTELVRDTLRKGRVQRWQKYVPTVEEVQEMQVAMQAEAMKRVEMEKMAMAQQAQQEEVKNRIGQAKQALEIKELAQRTVDAKMPPAPEAPNA